LEVSGQLHALAALPPGVDGRLILKGNKFHGAEFETRLCPYEWETAKH
jgi:hypothetical protein